MTNSRWLRIQSVNRVFALTLTLERHICDYASGKSIEAPIYDFTKHLRVSDQREHIPAKSLLIVEGILSNPCQMRDFLNTQARLR